MRRTTLLALGATVATTILAGTLAFAPTAGADPNPPLKSSPKGPIKGPIIKGPGPIVKPMPLPPPKMKPLPPPKFKPIPAPIPKKPLPPPPKKKGPWPPPKSGWVRPYFLPPIGYWLWNGVTIYSYDYDGCGYEYYKWRSTGSSYWRRMYRECRDLD